MKIWALFSIDNDYNQPDNNLVAWWKDKPHFRTLAKAVGMTVDETKGSALIGWLLQGSRVQIQACKYRLEHIEEGRVAQ